MHIEKIYNHILSVYEGIEKNILYYLEQIHNLLIMITLFLTASLVFMLDSSKLIFD